MKIFSLKPASALVRRVPLQAILFICGLFFLCAAQARAADVAFFFALDADLKAFAAEAKPLGQPVKVGDRTVQRLELGGHRVCAVRMGSGAVETAVSAAELLTRFRCDLALSLGPVGGLDDTLTIGSWHEVDRTVPFQHGSWDKTGFQLSAVTKPKGEAPRQIWTDRLQLPTLFAETDKVTVASGEMFVASSSYRAQLKATTGAQAVDMNLFGLEAACDSHGVPLFSWRVVSDRADDAAGESFRAFVARYDGAGGRTLAEIVKHLPANPNTPEAYPVLKSLLGRPAPSPAASIPAGTIAPEASPP